MKIFHARDLPRMPWKNGGGVTMEIAVHPAHAKMDDFDWRVSMAIVAAGGPFSTFPEIDRTLTILNGGPLGLTINQSPELILDEMSDPLFFAGDVPTSATLKGDPVTDLNVMTRRAVFSHRVSQFLLDGPSRVIDMRAPSFLVVRRGDISFVCGDDIRSLTQFDCIYCDEPGIHKVAVNAAQKSALLMVELFAAH